MIKKILGIIIITFFGNVCYADEIKDLNIFILSSYSRSENVNSYLFDTLKKKIEAENNVNVNIDIFSIDYNPNKWNPLENEMVAFLKSKKTPIDIVIAFDLSSINFLKKHREEIYGLTTPVIYIGENLGEYVELPYYEYTFFIKTYYNFNDSIALVKNLFDKVIVVHDFISYVPKEDPDVIYLKIKSKYWLLENIQKIIDNDKDHTYCIVFKSTHNVEVGDGFTDNINALKEIIKQFPTIPIWLVHNDHIIRNNDSYLINNIMGGYVIDSTIISDNITTIITTLIFNKFIETNFFIKNNLLIINYDFLKRYPQLKKFIDAKIINKPYSWINTHLVELFTMLFLLLITTILTTLLIKNRLYASEVKKQISRYEVLFNDINIAIVELNLTEFVEEIRKNNNCKNLNTFISVNSVNKYCLEFFDATCNFKENKGVINFNNWLSDDELHKIGTSLTSSILNNSEFSIDATLITKNKERVMVLLTCPSFNNINDFSNIPFHFIDITERTQKEIELIRKAQRDPLTQLVNREFFILKLQEMISKGDSRNTTSVLFIDLDKFKPVNDTYGHYIGDILLQNVAQRILSQVRKTDCVCRIGGDEFCIAINTIRQGREEINNIAIKILNALTTPFAIESKLIHIGGSIGIATYKKDSYNIEGLMKLSDAAMYKAKKQGGSCIVFSGD